MKSFAERLEGLMTKKGISKKQLSEDTGISLYLIQRFMQGRAFPRFKHLIVLMQYFSCTADYLLGLSDKENEHWV